MAPATTFRSRALRALTSSIYARGVLLVGQIGVVPVLATIWGREGYGEWVALTAAASYAAYSGLGLAPAIRADMAMAQVGGGDLAMRPTFQTAVLFLASLGALVLSAVLLATHWAPIAATLNLSVISPSDAVFILRMLTLQIVLGVVNGALLAGLAASGRLAFANTLDASRQALEFLAVAAAVWLLRVSPRTIAELYAASAGLFFLLEFTILARVAPAVVGGPWRGDLAVLRRIWRPTLGTLALNFGYNGLMVQAPRVIIASTAGPAAVASYTACVMLLRIVRIPLEIPGVSLTVEISKAFAAGDLPFVRRLLNLSTRGAFWLSILALPLVVLLGPWIVHVWSNGRLTGDPAILLILSLSTCAYAAGLPSLEALTSVNRLLAVSIWLLVLAAPFLLLCNLASAHFGLAGMASSVTILEVAVAVVCLVHASGIFRINLGSGLAMFTPPGPAAWLALRSRHPAVR